MPSSREYAEFVSELCAPVGAVRFKKMFGEYMVYVNDKPVLLICDDLSYVKDLPEVAELMAGAERGLPYPKAKEHWILDIDDRALVEAVVRVLEKIVPVPKRRPRKKKA